VGEGVDELEACCFDLGRSALDTSSNASKRSAWMAKWQVRSLFLVPGNYHTPYPILEFRGAMSNVKLLAKPVFPEHVKVNNWCRYRGTSGMIARESAKYTLVLLKAPFARAFPDNLS